jgi:CARDB protein
MRPPALLAAASVAAFAVLAAAAAASARPAVGPRAATPLAAKVKTCSTGADVPSRYAVFTGSMPRIAQATTLAMRFDLYTDGRGRSLRRVKGVPNFGVWERSSPGAPGFVYDKRVDALDAPAAYRVRVSFRWYDGGGHVVRRATRLSGACRQPDKRPDLQVTEIGFEPVPHDPLHLRYAVTVANTGRGPVPAASLVGLQIGPLAQPPLPLPPLAAGAAATVVFTGPACLPGAGVRAVADAAQGVVEADEDDDAAVRDCPLAPG